MQFRNANTHLISLTLPLAMRLFLTLLSTLFFPLTVNAATFSYSGESPFAQLHIKGEIQKGDYNKMLVLMNKQQDIPYLLKLHSRGGNVMEAIKIGSFARKYLIRFESTKCNSACAFILLGSVYESDNKQGVIGLHRPKFNKNFFSKLNSQQATQKYQRLRSTVESYMRAMGARSPLITKMFSIPSGSMEYLPKIQVYNMINTPPEGYSEWIISKCGDDLTKQEYHDLMAYHKDRTLFSQTYFNYLDGKSTAHFGCELESVRNEQVRLFNQDFKLVGKQTSFKQ